MINLRTATSAIPRLFAAALTAASMLGGAAHAAEPRVGVSVNISQPGFYGRINIGDQPPPAVIYSQPIIIQQTPVAVHRRPIYLRVPPGHSKNWARYCGRYSACGQPVYFVRYGDRIAPRHGYHDHDRHDRYDRREHRRDKHHDRHERREHRHDRGHGHGHDHRR